MKNKEIIDLAIADLDEFFVSPNSSKISSKLTTRRLMSASGFDEHRKLQVEQFIANTDVLNPRDFLWCLILAGHEMCHLMNNHNKRSDWPSNERRALETWADYFGARVTFTLISHGKRVRTALTALQGPLSSPSSLNNVYSRERILNSFGDALDSIYTQISMLPESENYPSPPERMLTIMAGVNSFFSRELGNIDEGWTLYIFEKLMLGRKWFVDSAEKMHGKELDSSRTGLVNEIHRNLSGVNASISPGLRPEYEKLIGTRYQETKAGRKFAAEVIGLEFAAWKSEFGPKMQKILDEIS